LKAPLKALVYKHMKSSLSPLLISPHIENDDNVAPPTLAVLLYYLFEASILDDLYYIWQKNPIPYV